MYLILAVVLSIKFHQGGSQCTVTQSNHKDPIVREQFVIKTPGSFYCCKRNQDRTGGINVIHVLSVFLYNGNKVSVTVSLLSPPPESQSALKTQLITSTYMLNVEKPTTETCWKPKDAAFKIIF